MVSFCFPINKSFVILTSSDVIFILLSNYHIIYSGKLKINRNNSCF